MGQCICKERKNQRRSEVQSSSQADDHYRPSGEETSVSDQRQQVLRNLQLDIRDLIMETLAVIRTLVNNEQEPPAAMLKLNLIAEKEQGWLLIVQIMIEIIPPDNPLGPAVITLFLDESPLPTKETVCQLLFYLSLSPQLSNSTEKGATWHRNCCIVLGCVAEKLAGPNSVATFKPSTLDYLLANLSVEHDPSVILFSLIALEKYAQTSENKITIAQKLNERTPNQLQVLESWLSSKNSVQRQVGFCAQWALDNLFVKKGRPFGYETVNTTGINVMLNHNDVSEYLKISPNGLEARCDVSSFESVRCTFQVTTGVWFYEALIVTPGVMQIGWATKDSKFLNHDGYGIGDDEFSVAYDGCRQLIWHNATSVPHSHVPWKPGDVLGCLLDLEGLRVMFYLNGEPMAKAHTQVTTNARSGYFAAASFMSFQQCQFNFGHLPFRFPPRCKFQNFNSNAILAEDQRIILPRHKKLQLLRENSVPENSCTICCNAPACVILQPCKHGGLCRECALILEICHLCRSHIDRRTELPNISELEEQLAVEEITAEGQPNL